MHLHHLCMLGKEREPNNAIIFNVIQLLKIGFEIVYFEGCLYRLPFGYRKLESMFLDYCQVPFFGLKHMFLEHCFKLHVDISSIR